MGKIFASKERILSKVRSIGIDAIGRVLMRIREHHARTIAFEGNIDRNKVQKWNIGKGIVKRTMYTHPPKRDHVIDVWTR